MFNGQQIFFGIVAVKMFAERWTCSLFDVP